MYRRSLYNELEEHSTKRQITIITGMRRVGISTAVKHLLTRVKHDNKVYLDFEKANDRFISNQSSFTDIEVSLQVEGIEAFEVKETPTASDLVTLTHRAKTAGVNNFSLIGRHRPASGFRDFIWGVASTDCGWPKQKCPDRLAGAFLFVSKGYLLT